MKIAPAQDPASWIDEQSDRLIGILQELVRMPSENRAPFGNEWHCQQYIAGTLRHAGWQTEQYTPDEVEGIEAHPLFWPGRNYRKRPNVAAVRKGAGGGRSLLLSGHIDTVPAGSARWKREPFGAQVEGNRLYGRGANDMKAGVAVNLFVAEALSLLGLQLKGDLIFESVVDEEFGGVNGTLAGRLRGYTADAAVISEPTALRICPAQRGGRTVDLTFTAPNDGILARGSSTGAVEQLRLFLNALPEFIESRRSSAPAHEMYAHLTNPVPVTVARIHSAPWGTSEPPNTPSECQVQLFWQAMPGESVEEIDREFRQWFDALVMREAAAFTSRPQITHPIRWLPGSAIAADHRLITEFSDAVSSTLGRKPAVSGIEGPCDMYVFHEFGIPAILWGVNGGNTHMPDEYVEIDTVVASAKALLTFVCQWCEIASR